jgi:hypothetical protein
LDKRGLGYTQFGRFFSKTHLVTLHISHLQENDEGVFASEEDVHVTDDAEPEIT